MYRIFKIRFDKMNYKMVLAKLNIIGDFVWRLLFIVMALTAFISFILLIFKGLNYYAKFY